MDPVPARWPSECKNCGGDVTDVPAGQACPNCGTAERVTHVSVVDHVGVSDEVTRISVGYMPNRPWHEKWHEVLRRYDELGRCYAGREDGPTDTSGWKQFPTDLAIASLSLKDWLKKDGAVPQAARGDVEAFVNDRAARPALAIVHGLANTAKHKERQATKGNPNPVTAQVADVDVRCAGARRTVTFIISYDDQSGLIGTQDAHALAVAVVADWREFFAKHGLAP